MILKKFGIILFLIFSLLPVSKIFAQSTNAGFVPANIWYSKDPFTEGDKIKIYTLIFNPDSKNFSGTVDFYDKDTLLGTKDFSVSGTSTKDISVNWTVSVGDHAIFAQIKNAKFLLPDGQYQDISLKENKTEVSSSTVNKKIIPNSKNIADTMESPIDKASNILTDSIQNIKNDIPASIPQTIVNTAKTFDGWRGDMHTLLQNVQGETLKKIDALDSPEKPEKKTENTPSTNIIEKPLMFVVFFFLSFFKFIFEYKILFYGILALFIFLIVHYIWKKIF